MKLLAVLGVLLIGGCANMNQMSPAQIAQAVKDKNGVVVCGVFTGTGGQVRTVVVNLDETKGIDGTITVDADCKTTVSTATKFPAKDVPVAKAAP